MVKIVENLIFGLSFVDMLTDYSLLHVAFISQPDISTTPLFIIGFILFLVSTYLRFSFLPMYLDACYNAEYPVFGKRDSTTKEWIPLFRDKHIEIGILSALFLVGLSLYLIYEALYGIIGVVESAFVVIGVFVAVVVFGGFWFTFWFDFATLNLHSGDGHVISKSVIHKNKGVLYGKYICITFSIYYPICWFLRGLGLMVFLVAVLLYDLLLLCSVTILKFMLLPCDAIIGMGYYTASGTFELLIYNRLFPDIAFPPDFELLKGKFRGVMCLAVMGGRGVVKLIKEHEDEARQPILHLLAPVWLEEIFENAGGIFMSVAVLQHDNITDIAGFLAVLSLVISILSTLMETGFLYANCVENKSSAAYDTDFVTKDPSPDGL